MFSQSNPYYALRIRSLKKLLIIYIVIERLLHNTILLHVATKLTCICQARDSLGRLARTHRCEANDTALD